MNLKLLAIPIVLAGTLVAGCVGSNSIQPNQTQLKDSQLVDDFCKGKGYDKGITETQDPMRFYEYWRDHSIGGGNFGYNEFPRRIICIKIETKESNNQYDYNDFYKWMKDI